MPITHWQIPGADSQPLYGNTHWPDGGVEAADGVVLMLHGFKGYKDYGFMPVLAQAAAERGLIAHRFNFSHSGMTDRTETFERPDLFEQDRFSKQIADVIAVAGAISAGELPGAGLPLSLFGHSRGGVTALLAAVELGQLVDAVISASAPHLANHLPPRQAEQLRREGRLASPSSRTGQTLYVGKAWLDEIEADPDRYDPVKAAGKLTCPLLFVHGSDDITVSYISAHALNDAPGKNSSLQIIEGANHTFNAPNPLPTEVDLPEQTRTMFDHVFGFIETHARREV